MSSFKANLETLAVYLQSAGKKGVLTYGGVGIGTPA